MTKCRSSFLKLLPAAAFFAALPHAGAQVQIPLTGPANNLYNTGIAADGTLLAIMQADPHYTYTTTPPFGTGTPFRPPTLAVPWVANTAESQWISLTPTSHNGPNQTFTYKLVLTNVPVGDVVHIQGTVAADDNATISGNSSGVAFSNFHPGVVMGNYAAYTAFSGINFVSSTTNSVTILVENNGGGPTGLNLNLDGSYYTALLNTLGLGIVLTPTTPLTPNQNSVLTDLNQINQVGSSNPNFGALITSLIQASGSTTIGADLDQLSPEKLGVLSSIAFNDAGFQVSNFDDYMAHRRNHWGDLQVSPGKFDTSGLTVLDPTMDPELAQVKSRLLAWSPAPEASGLISDSPSPLYGDFLGTPYVQPDPMDDFNFFVRGNVVLGQNLSQPELDHTDYTTSSFEMGMDYQIGKHFLVGALFDYGHTDTALDGQGSSATIDSYSPGVYASWAQGGWYADFLGTYSKNAYTEERHISFSGFNETTTGAPDGDQEMANLDGGYEFHPKDRHWTYGPTAGVEYTHVGIDAFNERGGDAADLNVQSESGESLRSRFGGRISYAMFDQGDKVQFTPYLDMSWQHEWLQGSRGISSSFNEVSSIPFTVSTPQSSRDSALLVAGLNADITTDMTLFGNYVVQVGQSDYFGQSIIAGMKIGF